MADQPGEPEAAAAAPSVPWRLAVALLCVAASIAAAVLAWTWSPGDDELTAEQAACRRFAEVVNRSEAQRLSVQLGSYSTLDPAAGGVLQTQLDELDPIPAAFPSADFRVVDSVARITDAGWAVLASASIRDYRVMVSDWSASISAARTVCADDAGFDTNTVRVIR